MLKSQQASAEAATAAATREQVAAAKANDALAGARKAFAKEQQTLDDLRETLAKKMKTFGLDRIIMQHSLILHLNVLDQLLNIFQSNTSTLQCFWQKKINSKKH